MLFLKIQETGWDLSLMKICYNLTKRTTKTEKLEKNFKMFIINFKTIPYKLTTSGNINNSILNYKPMRPVINLRLPKEQKQQIQEKIEREKCRRHEKNELFTENFSIFYYFLRAMGFVFFYQHNFKKSTNMSKYIRTTKFSRKHVLSTPLNSLAFNGSQ